MYAERFIVNFVKYPSNRIPIYTVKQRREDSYRINDKLVCYKSNTVTYALFILSYSSVTFIARGKCFN